MGKPRSYRYLNAFMRCFAAAYLFLAASYFLPLAFVNSYLDSDRLREVSHSDWSTLWTDKKLSLAEEEDSAVFQISPWELLLPASKEFSASLFSAILFRAPSSMPAQRKRNLKNIRAPPL